MKDRKLGAKLAEDYYAGKIDFRNFMMEFPENDKDNELFELYDLIEHQPPINTILGENKEKNNLRMERITEIIRELKK